VPGEAFSAFGDLAALLTFLDIPRAHIVGWSVGAGVAADFALAYPEMTRSMVQVAPWVNGYSSDAANQLGVEMSAVFRAGREGGTAEAVDAWVNAPFWMATVRDSAIGDRFRYIASAQSWMAPAAPLVRERLDPPAMDRLGDITQPVLLVTAEHDIPADVEVADLLEQTIPGARRVTMTGTGHMMHMERPDEFNSLLRDFLRSIER
jgi:pimeloyl-ACP methyl ester carboxylesterase